MGSAIPRYSSPSNPFPFCRTIQNILWLYVITPISPYHCLFLLGGGGGGLHYFTELVHYSPRAIQCGCTCLGSTRTTLWARWQCASGRTRLSVSTVNHTHKLSGITHTTLFRKGPVLTDRESVPTRSCSSVSPFLRLLGTEPSRMKFVRTKGCHVGLFREFVGTDCCT